MLQHIMTMQDPKPFFFNFCIYFTSLLQNENIAQIFIFIQCLFSANVFFTIGDW